LTFEWGLSKPDEQQINLHNFCELWLLSEDPIQMWSSNDDNTLEGKLSLQQIHLLESRIARPETPLGVEAYARCCAMERAPLPIFVFNSAPYTIEGMEAEDC
jgi:hypothetical protein